MGLLVLMILAIGWGAFLLPPLFRARTSLRPGSSVDHFHRDLDVIRTIAPARPGSARAEIERAADLAAPGIPKNVAEAHRRRRDVIMVLGAAAGLTLMLALALGGVFWMSNLLVDAALGGYLYLMVQMRQFAAESSLKVRPINHALPATSHLVAVRSSVG